MSMDVMEAPAAALAAAVRPKLITLAIPFHNERENLEELLSELISVIAGLRRIRYVVYDTYCSV